MSAVTRVWTPQRGAATLPITLVLSFVLMLSVVFAHRSLLIEARSASNHLRAAQADEAAEAGLEWALAQLNREAAPEACAGEPPWRVQAHATAVQARCALAGDAWACTCGPGDAAPQGPGFDVQVSAAHHSGRLTVTATGRADHHSHTDTDGATRQLSVRLGRIPGLDSPPAAALTVRGQARFALGAFTIEHTDPSSGGATLHAAAGIDGSPTLVSTPGTPGISSQLLHDPTLASLSAQGLHASLFRMGRAAWREQPMARAVSCPAACDAALAEAARTHQLLWLRGGLRLHTPLQVGTPQRPVVLMVDGPVELHAPALLHGLVYATEGRWSDTAGATVRGAVVIDTDLAAEGSTRIQHDAGVLRALHEHTGTYARLPQSWRDL